MAPRPATPELFNDVRHISPPESHGATFLPFPALPCELQLAIWTAYLSQKRLVTVHLSWGRVCQRPDDLEHQCTNEALCRREYMLATNRQYRHSKLLRVSQQARQAALFFYRASIVCNHLGPEPISDGFPLYFSPDWDVLHIQSAAPDAELVPHLLHDLKASDPLGVGVSRLALDAAVVEGLDGLDPASLQGAVLESLVAVLGRLRSLWTVLLESGAARCMTPYRWKMASDEIHHNRSVPVVASSQAFDCIGTDPRPIGPDLARIGTVRDPAVLARRCRALDHKLAISRPAPLDRRVLVAVGTEGFISHSTAMVKDRASARGYLARERAGFDALLRHVTGTGLPAHARPRPGPAAADADDDELADAVGFWLFPLDAFAPAPAGRAGVCVVRDLVMHPPQLCLFRLA